jgi:squalene-hopene/tetraprenyl-beta-curcumene cyclase
MSRARDWLFGRQSAEGAWCEQLEGDTTLESYWILIDAFLRRGRDETVTALAHAIRSRVLPDGGWHQYPGGPPDLSVSCLSYFALKLSGDRADEPHLQRSREVILALGGPEHANSYTRYQLAFFGQYPWSALPAIPPEMVLLPEKGPFSLYDLSSWSRTIFVPLSILHAQRPVRELPHERSVSELFERAAPSSGVRLTASSAKRRDGWALPSRAQALNQLFLGVDRVLEAYGRRAARARVRQVAVARAGAWMIERLENSDGLSAILPAMANSILALECLGQKEHRPLLEAQLRHLDGLLIESSTGELRMQPCLSPVWDTVLAAYALIHAGVAGQHPVLRRAASWLLGKQCRAHGDWARRNPAAPGGWYFENRNEFYPDVDDTCMALIVLRHARAHESEQVQQVAIERGLAWMLGMQNADGGFASFDRDNDKEWLTHVPFADHNAMIDPSTADITGRVLECLSFFPEFHRQHPAVTRMIQFLRQDQTADGSWYGRWGVNHVYGTWQVLRGLAAIGEDVNQPFIRRAVGWLLQHQNSDGGWGESIRSYAEPSAKGRGISTPSQTAWAIMGLLAAGRGTEGALRSGIRYLLERQTAEGTWQEEAWTGTGFPRVFYLNYHGYRHYFPLMALGQYWRARLGAGELRSP